LNVFRRRLVVDLFDPPQREAYREAVVEQRRRGAKFKTIAKALGITATAAQNAAALQRAMDAAGVADAYVRVTSPEECLRRLRRHRHGRFAFRSVPDFVPPPSAEEWLAGHG
jgi:site-specific DNA recombinase